MNSNAVAEIEVSMQEAKDSIELANALERLHHNSDFKKIVLEGYFKDEAVRLVHLKADPNMQDSNRQANIIKDMDAIGSLRMYFGTIYHRAEWSKSAIAAGEEELESLRNEEIQ